MCEYASREVLVLEDAPRPELGAGEVLIQVHAAAVNPLGWKVRSGSQRERLKHKLPLILGWNVSGVAESLSTGVRSPETGTEVFARLDTTTIHRRRRPGAEVANVFDSGGQRHEEASRRAR